MSRLYASRLVLCAALAAAPGLSYAQGKAGFEAAPSVPGVELTHEALLKGPLHKVAEPVAVEGHFGKFVIESKFGKFSVLGANLFTTRVQELQAIEELQKVQKDSAFTDALAKSAGGVAKFAVSAVDDPNKAAENIEKGFGTVLGRVGYMAKSGADYVGDKAGDTVKPGAKPSAKAAPSGDAAPPSFTGDPFGYNQARREW